MPLTDKGEKILNAMTEKYGKEKGKSVFYASKNKGTITGVDNQPNEDNSDGPLASGDGYAHCAGIMIITPENKALFLKRGDTAPNHAGEWTFPGGHLEEGEDEKTAAIRETLEETGYSVDGDILYLSRHRDDDKDVCPPPNPECLESVDPTPPCSKDLVDYTTFVYRVPEEFSVTLDDENSGFAWANLDSPPQPLHPGVTWAINRLYADTEFDVAKAMAEGEEVSPQQYKNNTLFDIRITGTGMAYRSKDKEFVWRDPSIYLNEKFLQRCNGLPVILDHPKEDILDTEEFKKRVIGTVFLPYIKNDEVWAIARIWDEAAAKIMTDLDLSTSPAVILSGPENISLKTDDGNTLLIEGKPVLLDHVAVCGLGVWDKDGKPSGVSVARSEASKMADKEERAVEKETRVDEASVTKEVTPEVKGAAKADGEGSAPPWLDKMMSRMDALADMIEAKKEEKKADAEEEAEKKADACAKADADEPESKEEKKEEKEEKEGMKKADSVSPEILERLARLENNSKPLSDADFNQLSQAQAKADAVYAQYGDNAPRFMVGEDLLTYRKRLAQKMQSHSKVWKDVNLLALDSAAFGVAEQQIYADSAEAAKHPAAEIGILREISNRLPSGHTMTKFVGDSSVAYAPFMRAPQLVAGIGSSRN